MVQKLLSALLIGFALFAMLHFLYDRYAPEEDVPPCILFDEMIETQRQWEKDKDTKITKQTTKGSDHGN